MSNIAKPLVEGIGREPLTLEGLRGSKVYARDLEPGCVIEVPKNAQVAQGMLRVSHLRGKAPYMLYSVNESGAFVHLNLLRLEWATLGTDLLSNVNRQHPKASIELLRRIKDRWQCPKQYDGFFKILAPSVSEYLGNDPFEGGASHAA